MSKEYDTENRNLIEAREALTPIVPHALIGDVMDHLEELGSSEYERGRLDGIASVRDDRLFRGELPSGMEVHAVEYGIFRKLKAEQNRLLNGAHHDLSYTDSLVLAAVLNGRRELNEMMISHKVQQATKFGIGPIDLTAFKNLTKRHVLGATKRKARKKPVAKKAKRKTKR